MQTNIVRWGNSRAIRLPKHLLDSVCLSDNDMVEVVAESDSIIIKKVTNKQPHKTIEERFAGFEGDYEPIEINWGRSTGKEIW